MNWNAKTQDFESGALKNGVPAVVPVRGGPLLGNIASAFDTTAELRDFPVMELGRQDGLEVVHEQLLLNPRAWLISTSATIRSVTS